MIFLGDKAGTVAHWPASMSRWVGDGPYLWVSLWLAGLHISVLFPCGLVHPTFVCCNLTLRYTIFAITGNDSI